MGERGYRLLRNPPELSPIHLPPPLLFPPLACCGVSRGPLPLTLPAVWSAPRAAAPDTPRPTRLRLDPTHRPMASCRETLSRSYGMRQWSIEDRVAEMHQWIEALRRARHQLEARQAAAERKRQERRRYLLGSFLLERLSQDDFHILHGVTNGPGLSNLRSRSGGRRLSPALARDSHPATAPGAAGVSPPVSKDIWMRSTRHQKAIQ